MAYRVYYHPLRVTVTSGVLIKIMIHKISETIFETKIGTFESFSAKRYIKIKAGAKNKVFGRVRNTLLGAGRD